MMTMSRTRSFLPLFRRPKVRSDCHGGSRIEQCQRCPPQSGRTESWLFMCTHTSPQKSIPQSGALSTHSFEPTLTGNTQPPLYPPPPKKKKVPESRRSCIWCACALLAATERRRAIPHIVLTPPPPPPSTSLVRGDKLLRERPYPYDHSLHAPPP